MPLKGDIQRALKGPPGARKAVRYDAPRFGEVAEWLKAAPC